MSIAIQLREGSNRITHTTLAGLCDQMLLVMDHSSEDSEVHVLDREDNWFARDMKDAIYVKLEQSFLNRGGGLQHHEVIY